MPAAKIALILLAFTAFVALGLPDGLNTYAEANFNQGLMQWLHASWGVGITLGPSIMTLGLKALGTWHFGYRAVGIFQLPLAVCIFAARTRRVRHAAGHTGRDIV